MYIVIVIGIYIFKYIFVMKLWYDFYMNEKINWE